MKSWSRLYLVGAAGAAIVFYLGMAALQTAPGFPLDDAWIHQVFARNLGLHGQFAYNPGQVVAGSTSPLWSLLLAPAYWVGGDFYKVWAYLVGGLCLALTAREVFRLSLLLFKPAAGGLRTTEAWAAALFTLFEWHLVWAAASGMETLLFTLLSLWLVRLWLETERTEVALIASKTLPRYFALGLVGGLLTLVRPEGLVLLALIGLESGRKWVFNSQNPRNPAVLGAKWGGLSGGGLLLIVPYLLFNYASSGSPLPTTFYAKSNGYASNTSVESTFNYLVAACGEIVGHSPMLFLLMLGAVYALILLTQPSVRATLGQVDWRLLAWPLVVLMLYALRLPVTYQHSRYLIPLYPFLILYGVWAAGRLHEYLLTLHLAKVAMAIRLLLGLAVTATFYYGAITYQSDVEIINDEQVQVGQWLHDNTPPDALIASHDIGAIEYFSGRRIVDTAGLVSPEFASIVRDEPAILTKLQTAGITFFALMPNWYPNLYQQLTAQQRQVFQPGQTYLAQFGPGNLMRVFKLR